MGTKSRRFLCLWALSLFLVPATAAAWSGKVVSVIDGDTDSVIATLSAGAYPKAIAVDPDTGYAYVTNENSGSVTVISDSDVVSATVPVAMIACSTMTGRAESRNTG